MTECETTEIIECSPSSPKLLPRSRRSRFGARDIFIRVRGHAGGVELGLCFRLLRFLVLRLDPYDTSGGFRRKRSRSLPRASHDRRLPHRLEALPFLDTPRADSFGNAA